MIQSTFGYFAQVSDLKEQVSEAEEGARDKAEELSEAVARLRQFEAGEVAQCR